MIIVSHCLRLHCLCFFFFNDTATTEIYTLSLHDALPISRRRAWSEEMPDEIMREAARRVSIRSEEHTSELQSQSNLVCRLLLEKKKKNKHRKHTEHTRGRANIRSTFPRASSDCGPACDVC